MAADRFVDLEESRPLTAIPRSAPQQPGRGTNIVKVHGKAPGTGAYLRFYRHKRVLKPTSHPPRFVSTQVNWKLRGPQETELRH